MMMKTKEYFNIRGIGNLDWAKIGLKGGYTNIIRMVWITRKYKNEPTLRAIRRRDKKMMTIRLGLMLSQKFNMPILVSELVMINEKNRVSLMRTLRTDKSGSTRTHLYNGREYSKFPPKLFRFFMVLKDALQAREMNCIIKCSDPGYIEITATLPNQTFNYPGRFILNVALNTDLKLNGERPQGLNTA
jgi:hypothetical protein